jgi:CHAT domain-containing protein
MSDSLAVPEDLSWTETLSRVPDERARRAFLGRDPKLQTPEAVQQLFEEVIRLVRVDLRRAYRLAKAASWLGGQLRDELSRALGLRALGHVYYLQNKHQFARKHYEAAIAIYAALNRELELARTMSAALQSLIYLGEYDLAVEWSDKARDIFEKHGDMLRLARLETNVGNMCHRQDRFQEAIVLYQRAYAVLEQQGQVLDTAIVLRNLGVSYISLNQFSEALETYSKAREFCARQHAPLLLAEVEYNVAYLYYLRGEYARAVSSYELTRELCVQAGDPYHRALCDLDQSEMYLELNMGRDGARLAESARAGFQKLKMRYEIAKATAFMGLASNQLGDHTRALKLFATARKLFVNERNRLWPAVLDLYRAMVLFDDGDDESAAELCQAAMQVFVSNSIYSRAAVCEVLLARLALRSGEFTIAQEYCRSAIERLETLEAPAIACHAYLSMGEARERLQDFEGARTSYETASSILEELRSELVQEDSKIAFLKDKLAIYEYLVALILRWQPNQDDKTRAFEQMERAKSRSLAELLAVHVKPASSSGHIGMETVSELRDQLSWTTHLLERDQMRSEPSSAAHTRQLREKARVLKRKLADALMEAKFRGERALVESGGTLSLEDIREALPLDTTVLEYYQCRDSLLACVLDRDRIEILEVAPVARIRERLRLLQFQFSKFRLGPEYIARFAEQLYRAVETNLALLYRDLIAPVRARIHGQQLVIVPHGLLHQLPFHALTRDGTTLLDEFEISFAPSASVLAWLLKKQPVSTSESLVMGVADPLAPHIQQEVETVASDLPDATLLLGEAATLESLRSFAPRVRNIHIAAHGYFCQENPMFSSIRLGDSALTLIDLYQLTLSADLVALSGCGTGINVVLGGDELRGLVRGLLHAGAHSMMVSLWDVHDESTTEFMTLFYKNLRSMTKSQALRLAALEVRKHRVHPYYWAPFVLVGKPN